MMNYDETPNPRDPWDDFTEADYIEMMWGMDGND